jgi:signal transduction histidine kinase
VTEDRLARAIIRSREVIALMDQEGTPVRYLRSTLLPSEEVVFSLYEGPSAEAVREANERAEIHFDRIIEAIDLPERGRDTMPLAERTSGRDTQAGRENAVAVLVEWEGVTAEQYDEMINRMSVTDVSLPGGLFHVAGPTENGWRVFDVWASPEVADRFSRETLMPILQQAGFPLPQVWTWPVYNTLSPPTEEVRASRLRIIAIQNAERRRLERDLHDGAQQNLIALKVKLGLVAALAKRDPPKARELLRDLETDAERTLESLRELARGLYPALLADQGLVAALEAKIRNAPIPVELEADSVGRYPPEIEAAVYFCCLEALQNVSKYANATQAMVRLSDEEGLTFEVSDEGRGFDPGSTDYGTGLQGMADRLDAIGGALEMRSAPGEGTTVIGRVPAGARGGDG